MKNLNPMLVDFVDAYEYLLYEAPTGTMCGFQDTKTWAAELNVAARTDGLFASLALSFKADEAVNGVRVHLDVVMRNDDGIVDRYNVRLGTDGAMRSRIVSILDAFKLESYRVDKPWVKEFRAHLRHLINKLGLVACLQN